METREKSESENGSQNERGHEHQHRFIYFKPITSMKVYLHQTPFTTTIKGLSPMSVIKCELCNLQFISVMNEDNDVKVQRKNNSETNSKIRERKISLEETFAAYYNTSQLDAFKPINDVRQ